MSGPELATRMSIRAQSVHDIEQSEINGSIRIETLRRVADALDCDLVYALVPRESLDEMVRRQALKKAARHIAPIAHHSRLEDQALSGAESRSEVDDLAGSLIDKRGLWSDGVGL
jgi:predicted DNA-binding mobile mystery protein A